MDPACHQRVIQANGGFVTMSGVLTDVRYRDFVADRLHQFILDMFPNGGDFFQQEGAPTHHVSVAQIYLEQYSANFQVHHIPPYVHQIQTSFSMYVRFSYD